MRVWIAIVFVAAVLAAAVLRPAHSHVRTQPSAAPAGLPSTTLPPPTSVPATTTTAPAPTNPVTTLPASPPPANDARVLISKTGVVLPIQGHDASGWTVETPCSKTLVLRSGTPKGPVQVVLDPGHGGPESGAVATNNGLTEAVLNMAVARDAKAALEKAGVTVLLTRTAEYRMTLQARADVALAAHPNVFLSIHHNAEPDGPFPKPGTETYYQIANPDSKRLAGLVYEEVEKALTQYQVAWVADTDAGAKYRPGSTGDDYYGVLRKTHGITAALAELSFITDPAEADLLIRPDVQQVEGEAVARGILRYLTTKDPGSGFTTPYPRTEPAGGGGGSQGCTDPPL